ncbi:uncharacterized protein LOC123512458 isoform X1 [Portunus trituberculatus]|uniref:uncharacterized protein LOC123510003 isoform X1 n=1 Tax=Portunus trituberculatus TaxID=210409 RepID=UPI001E1CD73C|nr:uncharacterized protein LOC123510003 isoform X1 [Portunus trituberculatus]XP_045124817.1 uncharacterized protein LOC123512458 isoform X1 [Portunus trituberculatus]
MIGSVAWHFVERSVQQGAVYTTRDKVGSCRPSPKHGASKSRASVRRWSTTRHKSGTGVPTTAQLRITNFVEAHVFHSLQKMTQTEEACGSAQVLPLLEGEPNQRVLTPSTCGRKLALLALEDTNCLRLSWRNWTLPLTSSDLATLGVIQGGRTGQDSLASSNLT